MGGGFTLYSRMTGRVEGVMTGWVEVYLVLEDDGVGGGFTLYLRMTGWVEGVRMMGWVEGVRMTGWLEVLPCTRG